MAEVHGSESFEPGLARKVTHQGKIVRELQELSMAMRMVPVQGVFQKMTRLARDLSHKAAKPVDFVTAGEETELDRTVVDRISDPLVHMVRNALDHGIEPPEARRAAGKPAEATLEVRVEARRDHVVLTVRDDGAGLSPERLRAAAVQRGLLSAAEASRLSDADASRLAFQAGVSTAAELTSLSGRGVGLDVVAEAARRLGGSATVSSERGRGTTFVLEVPVALSASTGLLFRAAGH